MHQCPDFEFAQTLQNLSGCGAVLDIDNTQRANGLPGHGHAAVGVRMAGDSGILKDGKLIARLHAGVADGSGQALPLMHELPAFRKLDLGAPGADDSLEFLREAESEVREVMAMLGG